MSCSAPNICKSTNIGVAMRTFETGANFTPGSEEVHFCCGKHILVFEI
jgi:hypothetical protein